MSHIPAPGSGVGQAAMHNLLGVSMPFEDPALVLVTVFAVVLFAPVLATAAAPARRSSA